MQQNPINSPLLKYPPDTLFPDGLRPQMPDIYGQYLQVKRYGKLWWDGGLADQPHIWMQEMDACASGEEDYKSSRAPELLAYAGLTQKESNNGSV